jgi:hypothetical protein
MTYRTVGVEIYLTSVLVVGMWPASLPCPFTPVPIVQEAWWAPEPVWTRRTTENSWPNRDSKSNHSIVQPVANSPMNIQGLLRASTLQCLRYLRHKTFSLAQTQWSWVRIPLAAKEVSLRFFCACIALCRYRHWEGRSRIQRVLLSVRFLLSELISSEWELAKKRNTPTKKKTVHACY